MRGMATLVVAGALLAGGAAHAAEPLALETKIPLGAVSGRIDHFGFDLAGQRLFVAELGNNTVGVIDLKTQKLLRTITGLEEAQGVGYAADTLFVANAGGGSVRRVPAWKLRPCARTQAGGLLTGDCFDAGRCDWRDMVAQSRANFHRDPS